MMATPRTCASCACFAYMKPDGTILTDSADITERSDAQTVCRRNGPVGRQVRIEVPRIKDGQPVLDKLNRPVLEPATVFQYGFPPTYHAAVCFDGWRPVGTLPGERPQVDSR